MMRRLACAIAALALAGGVDTVRAWQKSWAAMERSEHDLLDGFSPEEIETLVEMITRLRENIWHAAQADAAAAGKPAPPHPSWMEQRHLANVMAQDA